MLGQPAWVIDRVTKMKHYGHIFEVCRKGNLNMVKVILPDYGFGQHVTDWLSPADVFVG